MDLDISLDHFQVELPVERSINELTILYLLVSTMLTCQVLYKVITVTANNFHLSPALGTPSRCSGIHLTKPYYVCYDEDDVVHPK